jgi:hypothetical protein
MSRKTIPTYLLTEENIHAPKHSHLWIEGDIKAFLKCDYMILDFYAEPFRKKPQPLICMAALGLYMILVRYMWKGIAYSVIEFAANHRMRTNRYIRLVDELEDAELLHRVVCIDVHGHPYDLAMHTARPIERLQRDYDRLYERVATRATDKARQRAKKEGTQWPTETIDLKARLKRIAEMEHEIKLNQIREVIKMVTESNVGRTKPLTDKQFLEEVRRICKEKRLHYSDKWLHEAMDSMTVGI